MLADAQRRFKATADEEVLTADFSQQARREGAGRWCGRPPGEVELTLVTHEARALYEAGVVPVCDIARLCGVSTRTLYHHVNGKGWKRRRASVPRDAAKSERQKRRYRERMALRPARPRGLKARDPVGQAKALAATKRAGALAGAALAKAIARQDAEAQARMMALLGRALRDLAIAKGMLEPKALRNKPHKPRQRRQYQWRSAGTPPAWAERQR